MATKNGCTNYTMAVAKLAFWDGPIRCEICPCLETYARKQCRLTGEYLSDTRVKGWTCPLEEISEDEFFKRKDEDECSAI